jgi:allantoin racemase
MTKLNWRDRQSFQNLLCLHFDQLFRILCQIVDLACGIDVDYTSSMRTPKSFSGLVSSRKNFSKMRENMHLYGYGHRLASMRSIGVDVLQLQADRDRTCERLLSEGHKAIEEDGAEVLILGCAAVYGLYQEMQERLGVPVIDSVLAPFKYAEFLAGLASSFGWYPSRILGSEPPPEKEVSN